MAAAADFLFFSSSFCVTIAYACMNQLFFSISLFYSIPSVLLVILPRSLFISSFLSFLSLSSWNNVHHISCSQLKLQSIITNIFLSFSFLNFIFSISLSFSFLFLLFSLSSSHIFLHRVLLPSLSFYLYLSLCV